MTQALLLLEMRPLLLLLVGVGVVGVVLLLLLRRGLRVERLVVVAVVLEWVVHSEHGEGVLRHGGGGVLENREPKRESAFAFDEVGRSAS